MGASFDGFGMMFVVGVDVGTTFTGVSVARPGGSLGMVSLGMVTLGRRRHVMPSMVWVGGSDSFVVGEAAARRLASDPANVVTLFKREVGSDVPFLVGGRDVSVEEVIGWVVEHAVGAAETEHGGPAARVALTFPASWGPLRQGVLVAGARRAGVTDPMLVTEPEAAAAYYAAERPVPEGALLAVFDFGGGTLDVAVVHRIGDGFELLGNPTGDNDLGGSDIDRLIFDLVMSRLDDTDRSAIAQDAAARASLYEECVDAKEALSFDDVADVPLAGPTGRKLVRVTRVELEALVAPLLDRSVEVLTNGLGAANVAPDELHAVLLVGGTSRMPIVARHLGASMPCPIVADTDPKTSVALGAALLGLASADRTAPPAPTAGVDLGIPGLGTATLVGRGGYALVYRARQDSLDRDVAIKIITGAGFDLTARRRFRIECQTIGRLSEHPNIVNVHESGIPDDKPPYLVMSYVAGGSYQDALEGGRRFTWSEAIAIGAKVADALDAAHRLGVFHCDVKPANILISDHGEPLVADFGLARVAERSGSHSITGLVGTPHFASPEVFDGVPPAASRDIYGLAATLHALMSGHPPITADSDSILALMRHIAADQPVDLRPLGVPDAVAAALEAGLEKHPAERPATATELIANLAAAAAGSAGPARAAVVPIAASAAPPQRSDPSAVEAAGGEPGVTSRKRVAGIAALVAVLLVVAIATLAIRPWGDDPETATAPNTSPPATSESETSAESDTSAESVTPVDPATSVDDDESVATTSPGTESTAVAIDVAGADIDCVVAGFAEDGSVINSSDGCRSLAVAFTGESSPLDYLTGGGDPEPQEFSRLGISHCSKGEVGRVSIEYAENDVEEIDGVAATGWVSIDGSLDLGPGDSMIAVFAGPELSGNPTYMPPTRINDDIASMRITVPESEAGVIATCYQRGLVEDLGDSLRICSIECPAESTDPNPVDVDALEARVVELTTEDPALALALASEATLSIGHQWSRSLATLVDARVAFGQTRDEPFPFAMRGHEGGVVEVTFSRDGSMIASSGLDGSVRLWDTATLAPIGGPLAVASDGVTGAAFDIDGDLIMSSNRNSSLQRWDVDNLAPIGDALLGHEGFVQDVALCAGCDGDVFVSIGHDRTIRYWSGESGLQIGAQLEGHTDQLVDIAFNPSRDARFATSSLDGTVRFWDAETRLQDGDPLVHDGPVYGLAFSPDGRILATSSDTGNVQLWSTGARGALGPPATGHSGLVTALAYSPDSRVVVSSGADASIRIWDAATRQPVGRPLTAHEGLVSEVAMAPDGSMFATAGSDGAILVWPAVWNPIQGCDVTSDVVADRDIAALLEEFGLPGRCHAE